MWPPLTGGGNAETLPFVISQEQQELVGAPPWVSVRALPEEIRAGH